MNRIVAIACVLLSCWSARGFGAETAADTAPFAIGIAKRDITPQEPMPMWGYGARHDMLSDGILDPLYAKVIVIQAGGERLAIVGLDLGRSPTKIMMEKIRTEIGEKGNIRHVLISGSHTHHGPVIELLDREGFGKGKFDGAVRYAQKLPDMLSEVILEATKNIRPARIGVASKDVHMNRNRQMKREPKVTDSMLGMIRFDNLDGKPIAILVNYAAHPTMTDNKILKYSADYPGFMMNRVEAELDTHCVFMPGASGDMSTSPQPGISGPRAFGEELGRHVIELAQSAETKVPAKPLIQAKVDHFDFRTRVEFTNPAVEASYAQAFYPERVKTMVLDYGSGVHSELNTVLLNGELALVGGSGEFFCNHAIRLKQRAYVPNTFFFGYCNGHQLYYPTIEAVSEGGYGADPRVAFAEIGAGEKLMDQALINLYTFLGRFAPDLK